MTKVLGIDPSATATGLAALSPSPGLINGARRPIVGLAREFKPKTIGLKRALQISDHVVATVEEVQPDLAVVEGYAFSNQHTLATLVEIGTLIRLMLLRLGVPYLEPTASQVKKFATGNGNANKDLVLLNVYKRWGIEAPTNNVSDALAMGAIGLAHLGQLEPLTKEQAKIVSEIRKVTPEML